MAHPKQAGRTARLAPLAVFVVVATASAAAFFVARGVAEDQDARLLSERAGEVNALLTNSLNRVETSLRLLGVLASSPDPAAAGLFSESAATLVRDGAGAVEVAADDGGQLRVTAAAGRGPAVGEVLAGDRARLAARAGRAKGVVSGVVTDAGTSRLILAVAAGGSVALHESVIDPDRPLPSTAESPFRELRAAMYASPKADRERLVLTTEAGGTIPGRVERIPFKVGADDWLLVVGARTSLVGSFARTAPWLLLAGGLVCAALGAAVADVLVRRRDYATRLVAERTAELQVAHDELRGVRAFLERLLTAGPVLVRRVSVPGHAISYVSPNIERLFGVTEAEALAPGFLGSLVHPDDRADFEAAHEAVASGSSQAESLEYRLMAPDGLARWVSATMVPEAADDGQVAAVLAYILDVDARRQAEQARQEAQGAAERANHAKTEFLSRMSHELRTPLNAVLGFGQLLELEALTDDQQDAVAHILKGGRHLLDLINEVLDIARVESGDLALSPEPVLAVELVDESVDLIRPLADQRGIQLVVDHASCECFIFADRQRAKQVLLNLLSNAVKYNRMHGTIAVSCRQSSDLWVRIAVSDTGMGIPADRLGLLFTPFERLGAEQSGEEGTGIGLALSRRLAIAMGGILEVDSTFGHGSTFFVELPWVEGPVQRYERLGNNGPQADTSEVPTRASTVLHIEDNLANLTLVERVLAQRPQVRVIGAMQGRLGLELARQHHPVLVLLDLHLPDMVGDALLHSLRDDPETASIPVVIVSADATPGQVRRLLSAGAAHYLTKPIDVAELLRFVDEACSQS